MGLVPLSLLLRLWDFKRSRPLTFSFIVWKSPQCEMREFKFNIPRVGKRGHFPSPGGFRVPSCPRFKGNRGPSRVRILPFNLCSSSTALLQAGLTETRRLFRSLLSEITCGPHTNERACGRYLVVGDARTREKAG